MISSNSLMAILLGKNRTPVRISNNTPYVGFWQEGKSISCKK
nr:MAG TPA: hypothetical protein [Caudoviricetes sp.]